ncbi:MAG TPA: 30S ribosomal protein S12 methylthiotransferase RimO [Bacteroidales bacterium]|nr:30S ribosomal protein S12 methylthiotransferase RimO [Bacteroidales bacterium]
MPANHSRILNQRRRSINVVTLGCPKNIVDSEKILGSLPPGEFKIYYNSDIQADIVLINTCAFINDAKQESIDAILQFTEAKKQSASEVYVTGCLAQRYKKELMAEIPSLDGIFGLHETGRLIQQISRASYELTDHRVLTTPGHYAYLKISEGCDRKCSFCAIPLIRGANVSYPVERILDEAAMLAGKGVKELMVIAQDTTYYGLDIYKKRKLAFLLEKLSDIKEFEWIRLHYAFPSGFPEDVMEVMAGRDNICKYLDIPLQHINNEMLASMRRNIDRKGTMALLNKIRDKVPGIALRTAFITGYPGETPGHFDELCEFIVDQKFERMGVFTYSNEEGTAAATLKHQVSSKVRLQRYKRMMELQQQISSSLNESLVGKTMKVIIDRKENDFFIGRTEFDSPEIDNEVLISAKGKKLKPGNFYHVKITGTEFYDLYADVK